MIPCYRQAHFLPEAIESVLAQTLPAAEIVVIDDGSPDDVAGVASRYPEVRYIRQENQGLSAARNTGIRATSSELLVFLDSDDRLLPRALERGAAHLEARPDCGFAAGRMQVIDAKGALIKPWKPFPEAEDYRERMLYDHCGIYPVTTMYRRWAIEAVGGGFDPTLRSAEDWDMDLRIARRFPFHLYNEPVAEYRRHGTNMTQNSRVMMTSILRVQHAQRRWVRGNRRMEAAYRAGVRHVQRSFGEIIIDQIHADARERRWLAVLDKLALLARWYPRVVLDRAEMKLRRLRERIAPERSQARSSG
ncbi:MAG TPA: glycosyltransferase [Gemmatimonadaceae bacterium]